MKARFLENGLDTFDDHQVLELLLYYSIPQRDTNGLAHMLIDTFGTLSSVFDAPLSELRSVKGVDEHTALLIKFLPQLSRRYLISRSSSDRVINSSGKAGSFLIPYFYSEWDEVVYLVCLDAKGKVVNCQQVAKGSVNSAQINIRRIVEIALVFKSTSVILAHNHTSGIAIPSKEDEATTRTIYAALDAVGIKLSDHIVVADDDFVSMADNGFFNRL